MSEATCLWNHICLPFLAHSLWKTDFDVPQPVSILGNSHVEYEGAWLQFARAFWQERHRLGPFPTWTIVEAKAPVAFA